VLSTALSKIGAVYIFKLHAVSPSISRCSEMHAAASSVLHVRPTVSLAQRCVVANVKITKRHARHREQTRVDINQARLVNRRPLCLSHNGTSFENIVLLGFGFVS
jgi:hypothetical protein